MGAYHQLGHDSWNLVDEDGLEGYQGLILSPVNYSPQKTLERLQSTKRRESLEVILDPQFYTPNSERGKLSEWTHFDANLDTTDLGDIAWWQTRNAELIQQANAVEASAVCSLAMVPREYSNEYYRWIAGVASDLSGPASDSGLSVLTTALVPISELAKKNRASEIAGLLTSSPVLERVYLVLVDDVAPRKHRSDQEGLGGAVELIRLLEEAGVQVLVAFSGLDLLLWKAAGASHIATGKFLNLRRFTPGRWEEQKDDQGRVVPYWTDQEFVTWLREADLVMLLRRSLIDETAARTNPFSARILDILTAAKGEPWVGLGWRQYLWWAMDADKKYQSDPNAVRELLARANAKWMDLRDKKFVLYEADAEARWVTAWINALAIGGV